MFTTGITSLLDEDQLLQCKSDGTLVPTDLRAPLPEEIISDFARCGNCCLQTAAFDPFNDFIDGICVDQGCTPQDFCFEETDHRFRASCLVALDFLTQGSTLGDGFTIICNEDGSLESAALTNFPTPALTETPTVAQEDEFDLIFLSYVGLSLCNGILFLICFLLMCCKMKQLNEVKAVQQRRAYSLKYTLT